MFKVDADCFEIKLLNGYFLKFFPCDEKGIEAHIQDDFDEDKPDYHSHVIMHVSGNGANIRHTLLSVEEMSLQISTFAQLPCQ